MGNGLFDMHCHLGFAPDFDAVARGFAVAGGGALCCTVTPSEYLRLADAGGRAVRVAAGLHPWWVSEDGGAALELLLSLLARVRYVGEVGLDFGARHGSGAPAQLAVFRQVARALAAHPGKLVSLHAVRAVDEVLDELEDAGALAGNTCVLHWFSGTSQQLTRALRAGCWVSLGEQTLVTKRGRAYARAAAAAGRLLLETDWPPEGDPPRGFAAHYAHLEAAARLLADACGQDAVQAATDASRQLLEAR